MTVCEDCLPERDLGPGSSPGVHSPSVDYCGLCVAQVQCIAVLIDDNL